MVREPMDIQCGLAHAVLRLTPRGKTHGASVEVPLALWSDDAGFVSLDPCEGWVQQAGHYALEVLFDGGRAPSVAHGMLVVNGDEFRVACTLVSDAALALEFVDCLDRPFGLVCGYARMELRLFAADGREMAHYVSKDVVCQQDTPQQMQVVEAMVEALLRDPSADQALAWMMSAGSEELADSYAVLEGGFARGAQRSLGTYLAVMEAGLDAVEDALPLLRSHAASRIQHEPTVVDASQVKRMGAREVRWLAQHPESLAPAGMDAASFVVSGRGYRPTVVASQRTIRSTDVYENRVILAFLSSMQLNLADFEAKMEQRMDAIDPYRPSVRGADPSSMLMVAVERVVRARHAGFAAKARILRSRCVRLLRLCQRILPDVRVLPLTKVGLRRTKVFKEIRAYSCIYTQVERYGAYGESLLRQDGLALTALRLDRIYETYVLQRLLGWFAQHGYRPDGESGRGFAPLSAIEFGYVSPVYDDSPHVANYYRLRRGSVCVELFYEPVAFADAREVQGFSLHRLAGRPVDVYTPDYVLVVRDDSSDRKRVFVLDAKYRSRSGLSTRFPVKNGTFWESSFENRAACYVRSLVDSETGRVPDALWLLCGLEDEGPVLSMLPATPWEDVAHAGAKARPYASGIALVTPGRDIDPLFEQLGIPF